MTVATIADEPGRLATLADHAFAPVAAAVEAGAIPGATLGLVTADGGRAVRLGGRAAIVPSPRPVGRSTWWDIASLTKVLLTAPAALRLVETGEADLDDPLARHLPDLGQYQSPAPVRLVTLRDCLAHRSFLPAVAPIYTWDSDPDRLRGRILQHDWGSDRGAPPVYSDINYILLGLVLERRLGHRLDAMTLPAGLAFGARAEEAAATEGCPWRGRVLAGEVHDENAYALAGAAGHAGLFATIDGVLDGALRLLARTAMSGAAFAEMTADQGNGRALGWERRHPGWTGGSLASDRAVGHTGFTGVGLWLDPRRGIAWSLLTNRVHPTRHRETGIMDLRRAVSNIVLAGAA